MANDKGVRFVRINGRIVPIKQKNGTLGSSSKAKAPKAEVAWTFKTYKRDAGMRFKEGARTGGLTGAILGGFGGSNFGLTGAAAGTLIGAAGVGLGIGALSAAFGARKGLAAQAKIQLIKNKKKNKTGV